MDRRRFLLTSLAGAIAAPPAPEAQQAGRVYQVGFVSLSARPTQQRSTLLQALIDALREQNYVEGRNLIIRPAFAEGNLDRLRTLVADLVQAKVDVIVTTSTPETLAAKRATSTIPIVMTVAPDPVEQGLVASLARPGGNVTGVTTQAPGVSQKFVELLREAVPLTSRFAVVGGTFPEIDRELQAAAHQFGITLSFIDVKGPDDFDPALARAKRDGAGGIIVALNVSTYPQRVSDECRQWPFISPTPPLDCREKIWAMHSESASTDPSPDQGGCGSLSLSLVRCLRLQEPAPTHVHERRDGKEAGAIRLGWARFLSLRLER